MRKILQYAVFCLFFLLTGSIYAQSARISLNLVNVPLNDVLNEIEKKSDYTFVVNQKDIDLTKKVDAVYTDTSIKDILSDLFNARDFEISVIETQIVINQKIKGQQLDDFPKKINGKIQDDANNEPLPGASIVVKNRAKGTISDVDGNFIIEVYSPEDTLVISFIGYTTQEIRCGNMNFLDVRMNESYVQMGDVVVTALGIKREEKAIGYAVQKVDGESMKTIKVSDPTTSLTGKVSGLMVKNSTNFGTAPVITLRGENPLIVIDGVPTANTTLDDISPDDIQSIDVLKGATASALYGYRGASGAIMVTTVRGNRIKGLNVSINSSTMFTAGFTVFPETQRSYSSGYNGKYADDYIWGDKLDIGRTATLWDPFEMVWKDSVPLTSKGRNNLQNFQEQGYLLNNNISIINQGENGSLRASVSYVNDKGQFPNQKMNKITYSIGGDMKLKKLTLESNITYSKHSSPNIRGSQYSGGFLYNLIGWLGAEWDVREYKNYWMVKDEKQNWFNNEWYDNPYFLANEVITTADRDLFNGFVLANYQFTPWLKLSLRSGLDFYLNRYSSRNPVSARNAWDYYGYFEDEESNGYSVNNDLILSFDKTFGDFRVEAMGGGTIYFTRDDYFSANTQGGLSVPGFYSLYASVDPINWESSLHRRQANSLFGRGTIAWRNLIYLDLTGRNDWSSTLSEDERSYFYPSVAGSFVISELLPKTKWLDFWKVRASWTLSKTPAGVYDINSNYIVNNEVWGGYNSAYYPTELRGSDIRPQAAQTAEYGTALVFLKNRIRFDFTYYRKRIYDFLASATISEATGFYTKYVNTEEERVNKGMEIIFGVTPALNEDWKWIVNFNWSRDLTYFYQLDEQYSPDQPWVKVGERIDYFALRDWVFDPDGNLVHVNGFPIVSDYQSVIGYTNPDGIWGMNTELKYKNLVLMFSLDGRIGGLSFSRLDALLWNSGAHTGTDNTWRYDEVVNGLTNYVGDGVKVVSGTVEYDTYGQIISDTRVFAPNDVQVSYENYTRNYYYTGAWSWNSQDILDETFIKLRELSITYHVPVKFARKLLMKDFAVSLVGQNLFFWGKEYKIADPDYGYTWDLVSPSLRYIGMNLKANF
jgi:TonB-linked SusC/RagA family outer membrane protein